LRNGLIVPWGTANFENYDVDNAPWPTWDQSDSVDKQAEAGTLETFANACEKLRGKPVATDGSKVLVVDLAEFAARLKIPLREAEADEIHKTPQAPDEDGTGTEPEPPSAVGRLFGASGGNRVIPTASGIPVMADSGLVEGQLYADDLADGGRAKAEQGLDELVEALLKVVDTHSSYEEIRNEAVRLYADFEPPQRVAEVVQRTLALGELAGEAAAVQDT
jgi:hypothetical protein